VTANHDLRSARRTLTALLVALALVIGVGPEPVSAEGSIVFAADELLIAEPGTLTRLAVVDVDPAQVGRLCTLSVVSQNQASVHEGNDLIITSGEASTELRDVEAEVDAAVDLSVDVVLGSTIEVDLRMGPDRMSSLGFSLWLDCGDVEQGLATAQPVDCADPDTVAPVDPGQPVDAEPAVDAEPVTITEPSATSDADQDGDQPGDCPAADQETDVEPAPRPAPVEVPIAIPVGPLPCPKSTIGSLTIVSTHCPEPAEEQPAEPAPVEPAPPAAEPVVPSDEAGTEAGADTDAGAEVLGITVTRLPETPAAPAISAMPTYSG
jgi:hypothetical protein